MANQSIFNDQWIDIVFENRNKEYGAYQLRHENPKTTLKALGLGFMLLTFIVSIPILMNKFGNEAIVLNEPDPYSLPEQITEVTFQPKKTPDTEAAAPLTQKKNNVSKPEVNQSNLVDPTITNAQNATTNITPNAQLQDPYIEPVDGAQLGTESGGVLGGTGTDLTVKSGSNSGNEGGILLSTALDKQPEFPGGIQRFYTYVGRNFKTPDTEIVKTIKVYVSFVIEKDGTMTDIRVPRNPGFGLDKEAIRVLKSLKTKWNPGILNGEPVRTAYNLPIVVQQN